MNNKQNKRAFSLVELLVGLVIMGFITAGAVSLLGSGQTVALRQQSSAVRLNTERFTLESVYYELRKGGNLEYVEIVDVPVPSALPATSVSRDHYIYLDGSRAMLRIYDDAGLPMSSDIPLTGADGIETLTFTLSDDVPAHRTAAEHFTLAVDVVATPVNHTDSGKGGAAPPRTASRHIGLLGMPSKDVGTGLTPVSGNYVGNAVHFKFREVVVANSATVVRLSILSGDVSGPVIASDGGSLSCDKGLVLCTSFDYVEIEGNPVAISALTVQSIDWYIESVSRAKTLEVMGGVVGGEKLITDTTVGQSFSDTPTGQLFNTGTSYMPFQTGSGEWLGNNYVYFVVEFKYGGNTYTYASPSVFIIEGLPVPPSNLAAGRTFFQELMNYGETHWDNDSAGNAQDVQSIDKAYADRKLGLTVFVSGTDYITGEVIEGFSLKNGSGLPGDGLKGVYKQVEKRHLDDAVAYERAINNVPGDKLVYTNVANYSVVFDVEFPNYTGVFYVFLNGFVSGKAQDIPISGFMLEYDPENSGFIVNLYNDRTELTPTTTKGVSRLFSAAGTPADMLPNAPMIYSFRSLQNKDFIYTSASLSSNERYNAKRLCYTILEYKEGTTGKSKFIVRARVLKSPKDPNYQAYFNDTKLRAISEKGDRFFMGKEFYLSEPAWFGGFVGTDLTLTSTNLQVRNLTVSNDATNVIGSVPAATDLYGMKGDRGGVENFGIAFKGVSMDLGVPTNVAEIVANADRKRFYGLAYMADFNKGNVLKVHTFSLAPGFSGEELKAILPAGGKLLSPRELYTSNNTLPAELAKMTPLEQNVTSGDLNRQLFGTPNGSDGSGVGVTDIQYNYYVPYYLKQ